MNDHEKLVIAARLWLRKGFAFELPAGSPAVRRSCTVVLSELSSLGTEQPDAIGWYQRWTHLVEVKVSRGDFFKDKKKLFRYALPESGVGDYRWYFTLPDVIKPDDTLPDGWGWVVYDPDRLQAKIKKHATLQPAKNSGHEALMLLSLIRRQSTQANINIEYHVQTGKNRACADIAIEEK